MSGDASAPERQPLLDSHDAITASQYHGTDAESQTNADHHRGKSILGTKSRTIAIMAIVVIVTGLLGGLGVLCAQLPWKEEQEPIYSNGTHEFRSTVILISLDGVVNNDLDLALTPYMSQLAREGVRARWMTPSFPPITFPNHWSLVTGLYPETHGIVSNYFYDPGLNDSFYYKDPARSWDEKWWGGEPIWITAVRQHRLSATIMWPGCSTVFNGLQPTLNIPFSNEMTMDEKVDHALEWLDLPIEQRPQFIAIYEPRVDQAGHMYGPIANQTLKQLQLADASIGRLMAGLALRNLTEIIHVIVVSDHGMSATDKSRLIFYDDELTAEELALIDTIEAEPLLAIRPAANHHVDEAMAVDRLYQAFLRLQQKVPHFQVYKRQDIPERFHYSSNNRIPPLLVLPDAGWSMITRQDLTSLPRGTHGYDNLNPESRAIFVARGPAFEKDRGKTLKPFWNIELYNVLAGILHLIPSKNNGTLGGNLVAEQE